MSTPFVSPYVLLGSPSSLWRGATWNNFGDIGMKSLSSWSLRVQNEISHANRIKASGIVIWTPHVPDPKDIGRMLFEWREAALLSKTSSGALLADRNEITSAFMYWALQASHLSLYVYGGMPPKSPLINVKERQYVEGIVDFNYGPILDIGMATGLLKGFCYDSLGDYNTLGLLEEAKALVSATRRLWPSLPIGGEPKPQANFPVKFDWTLQTRAAMPFTQNRPPLSGPQMLFYSDPSATAPPKYGYQDLIDRIKEGWHVVVQSHQINEKDAMWLKVLQTRPEVLPPSLPPSESSSSPNQNI